VEPEKIKATFEALGLIYSVNSSEEVKTIEPHLITSNSEKEWRCLFSYSEENHSAAAYVSYLNANTIEIEIRSIAATTCRNLSITGSNVLLIYLS
jgi:hypothetical protein